MHPFLQGLKAPLHISHRGGAGLYPENTMLAFEQAVRVHRTDMLELELIGALQFVDYVNFQVDFVMGCHAQLCLMLRINSISSCTRVLGLSVPLRSHSRKARSALLIANSSWPIN